MSDDLSPVLSLPLIQPAQAQKHVTHNEALRLLDVLVQPAVASRSTATPPADPAPGARFIVPAGALGAWAGQDGSIAFAEGGGWAHLVPLPGWQAWVADEGADALFDGTAWTTPAERAARVARLGVGTDADATNRLAVASPATLLTHAGAGHQLKINKAAPGDTASLLFQTGWSGRAEIGTTGSDALAVKVSADGAAWVTALALDAATGRATGAAVTQTATDTAPGRLLKVGDFGLGLTGNAPTLQNIDAVTGVASGLYRTLGDATGTFPANATRFGHVLVHRVSTTALWQVYCQVGGNSATTGRLWHRVYNTATSAWMPWRMVYDQGAILGTVAQDAGVPTGALIETGSNANGRYSRWADGTQMCWHTISAGSGIAAGAGTAASPYATAAFGWTFPAAFALPPVVNGTAAVDGATLANRIFALTVRAVSATAATDMNAVRLSSSTADVSVTAHVTAIGRWF
jgi:hypothetical protein